MLETQLQHLVPELYVEVGSKEKLEVTLQHILMKSVTLSKNLLKIYVVLSYQIVLTD